jgi:large subunit ribosomal protein L30
MEDKAKNLAVVRVRGVSGIRQDIKDTLNMLHLNRNCQATLIQNEPTNLGMLKKAKGQLTWGEVSKETIASLLRERGRLIGNKKLTDEYAEKIGYETLDKLAEAIHKMKIEYSELPNIKPLFRLRPPKKGYHGKVKKSYNTNGVTGNRGEAINDLIRRMI